MNKFRGKVASVRLLRPCIKIGKHGRTNRIKFTLEMRVWIFFRLILDNLILIIIRK